MEKVFAYLRVSDPSQVEGDGLTRQKLAIEAYAKAHNLEVVEYYREEGVSGTLADRPALARLMVNLEQNGHGVKTVLIERLERLARDLMVQEAIVRDFQKQGFRLVSTTEGPDLCSDDPTRKLIRQVMGAVAEYDRAMTQLKLRAARDRMSARLGRRCEGQKPYGQTPEEQKVIQRMRAMRRTRCNGTKGMTLQEIADRLNDEGIRTKEGKRWTPTQVFNVVGKKRQQGAYSTLTISPKP
jgi:DNA invertase Pin-like site-specific DNA recombinase